jgi:hypothetical protein
MHFRLAGADTQDEVYRIPDFNIQIMARFGENVYRVIVIMRQQFTDSIGCPMNMLRAGKKCAWPGMS